MVKRLDFSGRHITCDCKYKCQGDECARPSTAWPSFYSRGTITWKGVPGPERQHFELPFREFASRLIFPPSAPSAKWDGTISSFASPSRLYGGLRVAGDLGSLFACGRKPRISMISALSGRLRSVQCAAKDKRQLRTEPRWTRTRAGEFRYKAWSAHGSFREVPTM